MSIQYTITVGEIITAVVFACGLLAALISMKLDIGALKTMVTPMWEWWTKHMDGRRKTDDEITHEIRGMEEVLALRRGVRDRESK